MFLLCGHNEIWYDDSKMFNLPHAVYFMQIRLLEPIVSAVWKSLIRSAVEKRKKIPSHHEIWSGDRKMFTISHAVYFMQIRSLEPIVSAVWKSLIRSAVKKKKKNTQVFTQVFLKRPFKYVPVAWSSWNLVWW